MNQTVDARGDACPIPVIKTKNAIAAMNPGETVTTLVDNQIAVENLTKMAKQLALAVRSQQVDEHQWQVEITLGAEKPVLNGAVSAGSCGISGDTVVQISASVMGTGDNQLGAALMKSFLYAVTQLDELPDTVLLYNGGAKLSCTGSDSLEDLQLLQNEGVEIRTCGTCLNFYGLSDQLAVGSVTNMYEIAETLAKAGRIIRP